MGKMYRRIYIGRKNKRLDWVIKRDPQKSKGNHRPQDLIRLDGGERLSAF